MARCARRYWTPHATRNTQHATRITHHASRITHHASRIKHHETRNVRSQELRSARSILSAAHAEAGHFEDAVKVLQTAIELLNQNGAASEARNLEPHLRSFQSRQPWREDFTSGAPAR